MVCSHDVFRSFLFTSTFRSHDGNKSVQTYVSKIIRIKRKKIQFWRNVQELYVYFFFMRLLVKNGDHWWKIMPLKVNRTGVLWNETQSNRLIKISRFFAISNRRYVAKHHYSKGTVIFVRAPLLQRCRFV